jgi:hypothetical protein
MGRLGRPIKVRFRDNIRFLLRSHGILSIYIRRGDVSI